VTEIVEFDGDDAEISSEYLEKIHRGLSCSPFRGLTMNAITRWLNHLGHKLTPPVDQVSRRAADIVRERRRKRLEAAGEADKPLDWDSLNPPPGMRLSAAETLRYCRQMRLRRIQASEVRS
jgi:hypothetical protein